MLEKIWRDVASGVTVNVWEILTEFSETRYSLLTPVIVGPGKKKNNCQSTHYRIVQKCLGVGTAKLNKSRDIKPHMVFKVSREIAKFTGHETYRAHLDAVQDMLKAKVDSTYNQQQRSSIRR